MNSSVLTRHPSPDLGKYIVQGNVKCSDAFCIVNRAIELDCLVVYEGVGL